MWLFGKKNQNINYEKRIISLEERNKKLEEEINNIKNSLKIIQTSRYANKTIPRGKSKNKSKKRAKRNAKIQDMKDFESYKKTRGYDEITDEFYNTGRNGIVWLNLSFIQLVEIITSYKKGIKVKEISKQKLLKDFDENRVRNYLYI